MYSSRYEKPRTRRLRGPGYLRHVLDVLKVEQDDRFREELRVTPATFDAIVEKLEADPIFSNDSNTAQMPVEEQVAITLYRFGHDGNAAGLQKVANWAGVGKGTVSLVTRRVMTAILRPSFLDDALHPPTEEEKEEAKRWVEENSCEAWRNGCLMVDGTLVRLFEKPKWYGESYFDRKSNYSLNIQVWCLLIFLPINKTHLVAGQQVVSLPNLRIIDVGFGHVGSTHDATAWEGTRIAQEPEVYLGEREWVWADSAYPVRMLSLKVSCPILIVFIDQFLGCCTLQEA